VHAAYLDIPVVDDDEGGQYLTDEFLYGGDNEDIVFEPEKENDKGGGYKILKISKLAKVKRKQTAENKAGKNTDATKRGNGGMVYFPGVGHIEELFHFRHIDNGWDGKEGHGK
jgi:hypothetical protein